MTIDTPALPSSYGWGFVVGQIIEAIADQSGDGDRFPESRPVTGHVIFEPLTPLRKVSTPVALFVAHKKVVAELNDNGEIIDADGYPGVWLVTGSYRVSFKLVDAEIKAFNIEVTSAHTISQPLNLATAAPYVPEDGAAVILVPVPSGTYAGSVLSWSGTALVWQAGGVDVSQAVEDYLAANPPAGAGTTVTLVDNGDGTWTLNYGDVDTTPPTPGTLAASSVTQTAFTLTVTGASDNEALHDSPYAFSLDDGATWSPWQSSATYTAAGLSAGTAYDCMHRVRDAQGNDAVGPGVTVTTAAGIAFDVARAGAVGDGLSSTSIDLTTATAGAVAFMYVARSKSADPIAVPAGWSLVAAPLAYSTTYRAWCWTKTLEPGDLTTHTWTWAAESNRMASHVVAYRGATTIEAVSSAGLNNSYSTTFGVGSLTTDAAWVVALGSCNYGVSGLTFTAPDYAVRSSLGDDVSDLYVVALDSNGGSVGPTAAPTITASASANYRGGYLIALA